VCVCVCVCVCERERERERERQPACVCVCVRERERDKERKKMSFLVFFSPDLRDAGLHAGTRGSGWGGGGADGLMGLCCGGWRGACSLSFRNMSLVNQRGKRAVSGEGYVQDTGP
jgi:hypothetical protein